MLSNMPPLKGYQQRSLDMVRQCRSERTGSMGKAILAVAPPGAGKSRCMMELAAAEVAAGGTVLMKVHRKMLMSQMIDGFERAGIEVGVIAPDYQPRPELPIQVASVQTLFARAVRRSTLDMPPATLVMNDEAHQQSGATERALMFGAVSGSTIQHGYLSRGVDVVGFTATPLMQSRIYTQLFDFATYSELRDEGMHQLVGVYGPDEIDVSGLKVGVSGEFGERALEKRVTVIFGSVYREWKSLNPDAKPAILFAPSVDSSRWFAQQFHNKGVPVAHIDAESILLPGPSGNLELYPSNAEMRAEVLAKSRSGEIKVVCNRFILREAIDMPWLYHAIFATVMGSATTALQSVGRLQRYWPEYNQKILQDHGGFFWRHGSPNSDRHWKLGQTNKSYQLERVERIDKGEMREGIRCPKCGFWRYSGAVCLNRECRHTHAHSQRVVRSVSGRLKKIDGPVYRKASQATQLNKMWVSTLFRAARAGKPVGSAVAMFSDRARSEGVMLDWSLVKNRPPLSESDSRWHLPVKTVFPWTGTHRQKKAKVK